MSTPLVSVVVPVHGEAPYLGAALDSVASQTYEHHETIIVIDGAARWTGSIERPGMRVLRRPHGGVAAARNAGLREARGELVALLDQDDVWRADRLELQVALLSARPEIGFSVSQIEVLLEPGVPPPPWIEPEWLSAPAGGFQPSTWLVRREAFDAVGGFNEGYASACDADWLARAHAGGWRSGSVAEPLVRWRIHGANASYDRPVVRRELIRVMRDTAARHRCARALRIGLVITAHNYERYIGAAVESALAQTMPVAAVIVVDDGSTDATAEVAREFGPPVKVVSQRQGGTTAARNRGIDELSDVDLVGMLDADDLLTPESLERRATVLATRSEIDLVFGLQQRFETITEGGQPVPTGRLEPGHTVGSLLVRRDVLERVGPFRGYDLDWLLRARELRLGEVTVPELVYWRRVHGANYSIVNRATLAEFPRVLKESLDRRRAQ